MTIFKSKAHTLLSLKLKKSLIPKIYIIKFSDYKIKKNEILKNIKNKFLNSKIAIRSSFDNEDTEKKSNAGKYKSFLNIDSSNIKNIDSKIIQLIKLKKIFKKKEHFFVQKMTNNVSFSGVVLTRNLEDYSRCININYYNGNNTEAVTSGKFKTKTLIYIENKKYPIPVKFEKLYLSIKEIIKFTKCIDLDIEFAVGKNNKIYILQVRKLIVPKKNKQNYYNSNIHLNRLEKKINKLKAKHHDLLGNTTFFGNMPDWNPAEIIGTKPRPLALSLYQELITDHIWSKNRVDYGYRDLSQFHLMTTFFGSPYIDVRIDFNSWLPSNINNNISKKIINYYLKKFSSKKSVHDKIEFEILFTCATFSTYERIKKKLKKILNQKEINTFYNSLKQININALEQKNKDIKLIEELKNRQIIIQKSKLYEIDKIYWLIEDCKKYGTLPFAGLARSAFIAIELLNSLKEKNIISQNEKSNFLTNIKTITSEMKNDLINLKKNDFINKYGHLRPGTYDINSKNYAQGFKKYFNKISNYEKNTSKKIDFTKKIQKPLKKLGIYKNTNDFLKFIDDAIKQREYSKFIFTKSIDLIFKNLTNFGKKYNISNEDLSYVKIQKILDMYFNLSNYPTISNLKRHIKENKKEYLENKIINLPDVIKSPRDLYVRIKESEKINFISNKNVIAKVIVYDKNKVDNKYNGIVCIENADPGYDFLFNKKIKGLITKYGGLNSHMSIRCSELNLPALIGVGEKNFNDITKYKMLKIDCISKKIEPIN
jgi:phosphohistidine swiveling domain-containing protein